MLFFKIALALIILAIAVTLITSYVCFLRIFLAHKRKSKMKRAFSDEIPVIKGKLYDPYREQMVEWIRASRAMPHKDVSIISFDGLVLRGRYFEYSPDAPIELLMHGYRGSSERDLSGGVDRCFRLGHSALIVDHRASGRSEGKVISFGINESRDCLSWIDFILSDINKNAKIILTGISMGAATVMICAGMDLPKNVIGVLADCGYTSAEDIIKKVMRDMKLPPNLLYPFARLGARLYGGFNVDETSPIESMKKSRVPVIFFHGDTDAYGPCYMSEQNYDACITRKKLVIIHGAGHGLCYPVDMEKYLKELGDFFE